MANIITTKQHGVRTLRWLRPLAYAHPTNYLHLAIATNSRHRSLVFPFFHFLLLSSFGQNQLSHLSSFGRFSLLRQSSASNTFHLSCHNLAKIFGKMKEMKKIHESLEKVLLWIQFERILRKKKKFFQYSSFQTIVYKVSQKVKNLVYLKCNTPLKNPKI